MSSPYVGAKVTYIGEDSIFLRDCTGTVIGRKPETEKLWAVAWDHMDSGDITYIWEHNLEVERKLEAINEAWRRDIDDTLVELTDVNVTPVEYEPIVAEAQRLVYGDRGASYGHPALDYARTAKMWSAILGTEVTAVQAIQCMIAVKLSRLVNTPSHRDSWVDVAGYAECGMRTVRYEDGIIDS